MNTLQSRIDRLRAFANLCSFISAFLSQVGVWVLLLWGYGTLIKILLVACVLPLLCSGTAILEARRLKKLPVD
jgi:hypothetical protein